MKALFICLTLLVVSCQTFQDTDCQYNLSTNISSLEKEMATYMMNSPNNNIKQSRDSFGVTYLWKLESKERLYKIIIYINNGAKDESDYLGYFSLRVTEHTNSFYAVDANFNGQINIAKFFDLKNPHHNYIFKNTDTEKMGFAKVNHAESSHILYLLQLIHFSRSNEVYKKTNI